MFIAVMPGRGTSQISPGAAAPEEKDIENQQTRPLNGERNTQEALVEKGKKTLAFNYGKAAGKASWVVNWILLVVKAIAFFFSASESVCASLADSAVDLISQFVLSYAEHLKNTKSVSYPVGRDKMEGVGVLVCAAIMIMACVEIIQSSCVTLFEGTHGIREQLELSVLAMVILGVGTVFKFFLWIYCRWANKFAKSELLEALAEDHLNDCFSNVAAIFAACVSCEVEKAWWLDAAGGVGISAVIAWRWFFISYDQVKQLVGFIAPNAINHEVLKLCKDMDIDSSDAQIISYNDGSKYIVELIITLPEMMPFQQTTQIQQKLKAQVSELDEIRRCYVEVDAKEKQSSQPISVLSAAAVMLQLKFPKRKKQMKLI